MKRIKIPVLLFCAVILLSVCQPAFGNESNDSQGGNILFETVTGSGYKTLLKNDLYTFSIDSESGKFQVKELASQTVWSSNPDDAENDEKANGLGKLMLESQLIVSFYTASDTITESTSVSSCIRKNGLKVLYNKDTVRCQYNFVKEEVVIYVDYSLNENGLIVNLPVKEIKENGTNKISTITVLPYFCSVAENEDGYILVPDGCGALIELNSGNDNFSSLTYKKAVYGKDPVLGVKQVGASSEDILLPVFGESTDKAVMGLITSGETVSYIEVIGEGNKSGYSAIRPICVLRASDTITLYKDTNSEVSNSTYQTSMADIGSYSIQYFLFNKKTSYSTMANTLSNYYEGIYFLKKKEIKESATLFLQTLGSVKKKINLFGIPLKKDTAITDYSSALKILSDLKSKNVESINFLYYGIYSDGIYNKSPTKAKLESALGNRNQLKKLLEYGSGNSINVFPMTDLVRIYKSGNGLSLNKDTVRGIKGIKAEVHPIQLSTGVPDSKSDYSYSIAKSELLTNLYKTVYKNLSKKGFECFGDSGISYVSSDYSKKKEVSREQSLENFKGAMESISSQIDNYLVEKFYGYMLPYISSVSEIPIASSRVIGIDKDVPFLQLVINKFIDYSSTSLNVATNYEFTILKMIEYGCMPSFYLIGSETTELENTSVSDELTGKYENWADTVYKTYGIFNNAYSKLNGYMTGHSEILDGVYCVTYSSGQKVYINYNNETVNIDNLSVEPLSYSVIQ